MSLSTLILAVAIFVAAPAIGDNMSGQFDLHCTGTTTSLDGSPTPWSNWIKIDLKTSRYCMAGCASKPPGIDVIQQVQPDRLVLKDETSDNSMDQIIVDRTDGSIHIVDIVPALGLSMKADGHCAAAPFTGFPKTLF